MPTNRLIALVAAAALTVSITACSSDDGEKSSGTEAPAATTADGSAKDPTRTTKPTSATERPDGPAAKVDRELTQGDVFLAAGTTVDLAAAGYIEHEYQLSGTAIAYQGEQDPEGAWDLTETGATGDYVTRAVVRRPENAKDASGVVLVEWLNVSGGVDANPSFAYLSEEILRQGHTWIGLSVQSIGIEGGATAVGIDALGDMTGKGLKAMFPDRYGELKHPGDEFSYDLYSQVGRATRANAGDLLGDIEPTTVLAVGESQSAFALTTYADGVQPLTETFDGFFIHSRGGAPLPLAPTPGTEGMDIAGALTLPPVKIREDLSAPVLQFQTETDVTGILGFAMARQPDSGSVHTWEVAGTSHIDARGLGAVADSIGCNPPVNNGPHHLVAKAALRALVDWVTEGTVPPSFDPLTTEPAGTAVRDDLGIAEGGIRSPLVDVPVDVLSGDAGEGASTICMLAGSTVPIDASVLADRYGTAVDYTSRYEAATDAAIKAGTILEEERQATLDMASPDRIPA